MPISTAAAYNSIGNQCDDALIFKGHFIWILFQAIVQKALLFNSNIAWIWNKFADKFWSVVW